MKDPSITQSFQMLRGPFVPELNTSVDKRWSETRGEDDEGTGTKRRQNG